MMEILVDLCRDQGKGEVGSGEKSTKKVGDIICAKKSPAVWGNEEKRLFLITYLEDLETENKKDNLYYAKIKSIFVKNIKI